MPKLPRTKQTVDLTHLVRDGHTRLTSISAKCPRCGTNMIVCDMERTSDKGDVFNLACGGLDNDYKYCPFYALIGVKDGESRLLECGYDYAAQSQDAPDDENAE